MSSAEPRRSRHDGARLGRLAVAIVGLLALVRVTLVAASSAVEAMRLASEASRALQANDPETSAAKLEAAVALRPDFVHLYEPLTSAQVAQGKPAEAITTLDRLAKMGLYLPVERSEELAPLRSQPGFPAVAKQLAANLHSRGAGDVAFSLRDVSGLIEGIAWRERTGEFYFGDAAARCVWVRNKEGALRRLTAEAGELWGVFGIAIDEATGALWAATSAVPAMQGFTPDLQGMAALAEIDLESGALRRTIPVPRSQTGGAEHFFGDVALSPDGAVLVTDSSAPTLWRLAPGGPGLEPFVQSDEFFSLEGVAVVTESVAIVSDRTNGLLRVDLVARAARRLEPPPDSTLLDVEGVISTPSGQVLALQTGLRPTRVLRIDLDAAAETIHSVQVLESGHMAMAAPSRGCLGTGGDLFYIGFAGRARFASGGGEAARPRPVPIFRTKTSAGKR